jgi:hypothetical protein
VVAEGCIKKKAVLITNKRWRDKLLKRDEIFVA